MNLNPISPELLKRYLDGQCTTDEANQVEAWYASINKGEANSTAFNQAQHLKKVQATINQHDQATNITPQQTATIRPLNTFWVRYAAAAIVVLIAGLGSYFYLTQTGHQKGENDALVSFANTQKRVVRHQLPDGSQVWLSPDATLQYTTKGFSEKLREVRLEGEAFFDVIKDPAHPFLVRSQALVVKVLGTSFNVKSTPNQSRYEVSVVTGKVSVSVPGSQGKENAVLLLPHQQAVFERSSGRLTSIELPKMQEQVSTWQPISLTFTDERLGNVVKQLEKKYGVKIRLANPNLANCRLKASFDNNRLAEILEITTQMLDAQYQMQGDTILIEGEGCPSLE